MPVPVSKGKLDETTPGLLTILAVHVEQSIGHACVCLDYKCWSK